MDPTTLYLCLSINVVADFKDVSLQNLEQKDNTTTPSRKLSSPTNDLHESYLHHFFAPISFQWSNERNSKDLEWILLQRIRTREKKPVVRISQVWMEHPTSCWRREGQVHEPPTGTFSSFFGKFVPQQTPKVNNILFWRDHKKQNGRFRLLLWSFVVYIASCLDSRGNRYLFCRPQSRMFILWTTTKRDYVVFVFNLVFVLGFNSNDNLKKWSLVRKIRNSIWSFIFVVYIEQEIYCSYFFTFMFVTYLIFFKILYTELHGMVID